MRRIAILILISVFFIKGKAQSDLNQANVYFKNNAYSLAIPIYKNEVDKNPKQRAIINLAECYRKLSDYKNALPYYEKAVQYYPDNFEILMAYGITLLANDQCTLAKKIFDKYSTRFPKDTRAKNLAQSCEMKKEMTQYEAYVKIKPLEINTENNEFGAVWYNGGLVFSSDKNRGGLAKRISAWNNAGFTDLYYTLIDKYSDGSLEYSKVVLFDNIFESKYHDANAIFTENGKIAYFSRTNTKKDKNGFQNLEILKVEKKGKNWGKEISLNFIDKNYNYTHPALYNNGEYILFASDMEGGLGGMDIWFAKSEGNTWAKPVNAGPSINTAGNEVFPYVATDNTIYFSSDGHAGLGGLDVYVCGFNNEIFSDPYNVGSPINSIADDFGISIDANNSEGFFSSNREGGKGGDDLYSFERENVFIEGYVVDKNSGKPYSNVYVTASCFGAKVRTDKNGRYSLQLPLLNECCIKAMKEGFTSTETCIDLKNYSKGDKIAETIFIEREIELKLQGILVDKVTGKAIPNAKIDIMNNSDNQLKTLQTNDKGIFEIDIENNNCYEMRSTAMNYSNAYSDLVCAKNVETSKTFTVKLQAEPQLMASTNTTDNTTRIYQNYYNNNATTEVAPLANTKVFNIRNIYYNFGKSSLRRESVQELKKLVRYMRSNIGAIVEISAYSDSRGSAFNNEKLSQRRAQEVKNYLIKNGIQPYQIVAVGKGETNLLNNCIDGTKCSEKEHEMNRRTEFKVFINGETYISTAPDFIQTDWCKKCK